MTFEYSANFELKIIYTIKSMKFDYCINFVILKKKKNFYLLWVKNLI